MHKSRKSPSRAPLRREGDSPLFSTASRVKLIRGLSGSTKANDRIRPRLRQPNPFSLAVVLERACRTHPIWFQHFRCTALRPHNAARRKGDQRMFCPKCGARMEKHGDTLKCVQGEMELTLHMAAGLREAFGESHAPLGVVSPRGGWLSPKEWLEWGAWTAGQSLLTRFRQPAM